MKIRKNPFYSCLTFSIHHMPWWYLTYSSTKSLFDFFLFLSIVKFPTPTQIAQQLLSVFLCLSYHLRAFTCAIIVNPHRLSLTLSICDLNDLYCSTTVLWWQISVSLYLEESKNAAKEEDAPTLNRRRGAIKQAKIHFIKNHEFIATFFRQPTFCSVCREFVWSVQLQAYKQTT